MSILTLILGLFIGYFIGVFRAFNHAKNIFTSKDNR